MDDKIVKDFEEVVARVFRENFDEAFTRSFDQSFTKAFDQAFDRKFDEKFDKAFDRKFDEAFDQAFDRNMDKKFEDRFIPLFNQGFEEVVQPELKRIRAEMATKDDLEKVQNGLERLERKLDRVVDQQITNEYEIKQLKAKVLPA